MIKFTDRERREALSMLDEGIENVDRLLEEIKSLQNLIATYDRSKKKMPLPAVAAAKQTDLHKQCRNLLKSRNNLREVYHRIEKTSTITEEEANEIVDMLDEVRKLAKDVFASSDEFAQRVKTALENN